jgi:hypothetical protein
MNAVPVALCAGAMLGLAAGGLSALAKRRQPALLLASDLPGTYELMDRGLDSGKVLRRPDIAALYSFAKGRAGRVSGYHGRSTGLYRGHQGSVHRSLAGDQLKLPFRTDSFVESNVRAQP